MNGQIKIQLYGFYGVGELCDDFMAITTKNTFEEISERPIQWIPPGVPPDLIILGGGSLLGSVPLYNLRAILEKTDCPFCIFGTGVRDTQKGPFLPDLQYLWNRASSIFVRGETSVDRLKQWGIDTAKIETLGDPIFLSDPSNIEKEGYIGGVIRPTICNGTWMKNSFGFLHNTRNQPVKLFNFCEQQLDKFCNELTEYESYSLDVNQTWKGIAKSSFWFGNRLHAFCAALIGGVPTIGVEIEFKKIEDVCTTLDYPYWVYAGNSIETKYYQLIENWDNINKQLQDKIATIRNNLRNQIKHILEMVK